MPRELRQPHLIFEIGSADYVDTGRSLEIRQRRHPYLRCDGCRGRLWVGLLVDGSGTVYLCHDCQRVADTRRVD